MGCISVPTGVGNSEQQVLILKDLKVEAYLGTPSFLAALADKAEEMGLNLTEDLNLQVAFVAAEMLPESLRSSLEERLGMIIRQSYGTADAGCLSYECYTKAACTLPRTAWWRWWTRIPASRWKRASPARWSPRCSINPIP
jgi:phenylacetate-coenzyme A ligase PaaK-like adenylate-forming protein